MSFSSYEPLEASSKMMKDWLVGEHVTEQDKKATDQVGNLITV